MTFRSSSQIVNNHLNNKTKSSENLTSALTDSSNHSQSKRSKKPHQITYYELLELEKERNESKQVKVKIKRNFPIAPDGFIPNSVVRKFFKLLQEEPKKPEKKIWKLKWV
jgi:hypothetical protein